MNGEPASDVLGKVGGYICLARSMLWYGFSCEMEDDSIHFVSPEDSNELPIPYLDLDRTALELGIMSI